MMQIVRRKTESVSATTQPVAFVSSKYRRLETAFISLAATNLFMLSSAAAFYLLAHHS